MPGLPPDVEFNYYQLNIPPLNPTNTKLKNAEKLFVDEIKGPEDFAVYKNELYTGAHGGYVYKITNGKLVPIIKFGRDCKGFHEEEICGRPLGLRFNSKGLLHVCDAYYGVMKVNITTGAVNIIAPINEPIDGVTPQIPNGLAVSEKTGDIYWTDSSTSHQVKDGLYTLLGNGNGRLIKFNAAKGKNEVLLKNLHFPNGVALSKDESFLVVAETMRARLLKYHLKGPKAGTSEVFAELPGFPDNIELSGGNFNVGIGIIPDTMLKTLPEWPIVRKLASRILTIIEIILDYIYAIYPDDLIKKASHWIGHFESVIPIIKPQPIFVLFFNENGKIVEALHEGDNRIGSISSFISHQGYYYLGSPFSNHLTRVKIVK